MSTNRNLAFDWFKGLLIISVIIGHWVLGSIHSQPVRFFIYAFHMPLFIAMSGFLINAQTLKQSRVWSIAERYWYRVVLPFIPAFLFFTGVLITHAAMEDRLGAGLAVGYLTTPYYHLWYIPTLLLWVGFAIVLLKLRVPIALVTAMAAIPAISWAGMTWINPESSAAVLVDKKVFFYAYFFFFGMLCRQYWGSISSMLSKIWPVLALIVLFSFYVVLTFIDQAVTPQHAIAWFTLNTGLILLMLHWAHAYADKVEEGAIVAIGRNSLPIYLWHVLPLFLLKGFGIHLSSPLTYYAISLLTLMGLVFVVLRFESRTNFLNLWVYGQGPSAK